MSDDHLLPPPGYRQRGPAPTETQLLLIRHGECVANATGIVGGPRGDGGLTADGIAQALALRDRLARTGECDNVDALYSSNLPRAMETLALLRPALPPLTPRVHDGVHELSMGEGDGLTWTEFASRYPSPDWDLDPSAVSAPGSESLLAFYERALQGLSDIVRQHPRQRVLVVCHGGVIEQAMKKSLGRPARERLRLRTEHCSMTEFEVRSEGWRLLRYNDAAPVAR